jgi:hypothetical protein
MLTHFCGQYLGDWPACLLTGVTCLPRQLEYMGRSRCAWCTNVDPAEGFHFGFFETTEGASTEPCCNACAIKVCKSARYMARSLTSVRHPSALIYERAPRSALTHDCAPRKCANCSLTHRTQKPDASRIPLRSFKRGTAASQVMSKRQSNFVFFLSAEVRIKSTELSACCRGGVSRLSCGTRTCKSA